VGAQGDVTAEPSPQATPHPPEEILHVAALQMDAARNDQESNLKKADRFCRWAKERGADVVLFPEMWNIGYTPFQGTDPADRTAWQAQAVERDGAWVGHFRKLAQELEMAIAATYLEAWPGAPRNSLTLIDRKGRDLFTYAKVHTCDFSNFEAATTPGEEFHVGDLETAKGPIAMGAMVCFDREFPESARILMHKGAEVILCPNACLLDDLRIAQFQVRAHENSVCTVMTNYPEPFMNGRSVAFDVGGGEIMQAGAAEGIYSALFHMPSMRQYRRTTIWGDAFRRPHRYGALLETTKLQVWERETGLGEPFVAVKR
jgi:predicted amidohydrolase